MRNRAEILKSCAAHEPQKKRGGKSDMVIAPAAQSHFTRRRRGRGGKIIARDMSRAPAALALSQLGRCDRRRIRPAHIPLPRRRACLRYAHLAICKFRMGCEAKLSYHASYLYNTTRFCASSLPAAVRQTLSDNAKSARQNPRKIQKISSEKIIKLTTKNIPTRARREDYRARYVAHPGCLSVVATWKM